MIEYEALKERHKCIQCYKVDERTLKGHTLCEKCRQKANEYAKSKYNYRRNNRLCVTCGKPIPAGDNHKNCKDCRMKANKRRNNFD